MVDLASLVVRLVAETGRYERDLERARRSLLGFDKSASDILKGIGKTVAAAGIATAVGLAAMAKSAIDAADNLNDLSKITGVSVESLSQLRYAAEQSGTDLEGLTTGLKKFNKQAAEAAGGSKTAAESFALIGVSVEDAAGRVKPTEQLLLEVAEKFARFKDGAGKTAAAIDLFGKSGAALIPFLNNGARGIRELMIEAEKLGLTVSKKTAVAADEFNDKLNKLGAQLSVVGLALAERFLPALINIADVISDMLSDKSDLKGFLDVLADGFKAVAYAGISVIDLFQDIQRVIGAFYAAEFQLARGNVKQAVTIYHEFINDAEEAERKTTERLAKIWDDRAGKYNNALSKYKYVPNRGGPTSRRNSNPPLDFPVAKKVIDPLQEVEIKLKKKQGPTELEEYFDELDRKTQTSVEKIAHNYEDLRAALQIQLMEGKFDLDEYNTRLKEIQNDVLFELTKGPAKVQETVTKTNEYFLEAARNTQDIIASTFESLATGADISFNSILKSFGAMIVKLAAQAAAANLASYLFGDTSSEGAKGGKTGGLVGSVLGAFLKRDSGGRGHAGMAYAIGRGAQPEVFVPDSSGSFYPAGKGGAPVTINFTMSGDQPVSRKTQMQIAAAASRGVARAGRRNN